MYLINIGYIITMSILITLQAPAAGRDSNGLKKMYSIKNGVTGEYFFGNKISDYGIEHGRVDYRTLAKAFNCVLNNTIYGAAWDLDDWEQISGFDNDTEDSDDEYTEYEPAEIFQFYIVDDNGAEILQEIDEIVFYNSALDVYLWGVTHWGTSWDYVLTDIPCNCGYGILDN